MCITLIIFNNNTKGLCVRLTLPVSLSIIGNNATAFAGQCPFAGDLQLNPTGDVQMFFPSNLIYKLTNNNAL